MNFPQKSRNWLRRHGMSNRDIEDFEMHIINRKHCDFIRSLPCLKCGKAPSEAAHVRYSDARAAKVNPGIGAKPEDRWTVPLCAECHRGLKGQHTRGEQDWYYEAKIDPIAIAAFLWGCTGDYESGCQIVRHAYFHS